MDPPPPALAVIMDIGVGSGRDAAWLASPGEELGVGPRHDAR